MTTTRAPRVGSKRTLQPAGILDMFDDRVTDHTGHTVELTQPFGCPRNGTMGMAYVDCVTCGAEKARILDIDPEKSRIFVGLVNIASLVKEGN